MSIVNDALKKAGREFEQTEQGRVVSSHDSMPSSEKKWSVMITISLVIIASLFGSLILYKNMARINANYAANEYSSEDRTIRSTLNNIEQNIPANRLKQKDMVKLDGIVCDSRGNWAIVNNKIVKEGDDILGGKITSITRDIVKIEKKDGSEIALTLK